MPQDCGVEVCGAQRVDGGAGEVNEEREDVAAARVIGVGAPGFEGLERVRGAGEAVVGFIDAEEEQGEQAAETAGVEFQAGRGMERGSDFGGVDACAALDEVEPFCG